MTCSRASWNSSKRPTSSATGAFHSEGLEISPAPLLLNAYLGTFTRRLNHGQLGIVLPPNDPIRIAEECAIVDHMLNGRFFVGVARGYQARWQNVIG